MLSPDYQDILSIFAEEKVEFLVVGAYALAAHGLPRATGDIDLWVRADADNAERVFRSLARFGAPLAGLNPTTFTEPDVVFQIGIAPNRIDILTSLSGVDFEKAWPTRRNVVLGELEVGVISAELLIQNKRATGRAKDLLDASWLEAQRKA